MYFVINNNTVSKLYCGKDNIILPWGVETADDSSFFSLERGIGWRRNILLEEYKNNEQFYRYKIVCKMNNGLWKIKGEDEIVQNSILRKLEMECLEDTLLMDFVLRFRFNNSFFNYAYIAGKKIEHLNTNIYHQYKADKVMLEGDKYNVKISIVDCECSDKMQPEMYVRDAVREWVVHARMMPKMDEVKIIKLCNAWYKTKPLPSTLNRILCNNKKVYNYLKYHNEKNPYKNFILQKINPNAFPMVWLKKGTKIFWNVICTIESIR